jgi:hypothetical protein
MTRQLLIGLVAGLVTGLVTALGGVVLTSAASADGVTVIGHATVVSCNR